MGMMEYSAEGFVPHVQDTNNVITLEKMIRTATGPLYLTQQMMDVFESADPTSAPLIKGIRNDTFGYGFIAFGSKIIALQQKGDKWVLHNLKTQIISAASRPARNRVHEAFMEMSATLVV